MRKAVLFMAVLFLTSFATAEVTTFYQDDTRTVNIGGEEIDLKLKSVDDNPNNDGLYLATFRMGDAVKGIHSWNAHQFESDSGNQYLHSSLNDEPVAIMDWEGANTDTVDDDQATLAWGDDYFPCEEYDPVGNEYKFCGVDQTQTVTSNNEDTELEFNGVSYTNTEYKQANFVAANGGTQTFIGSEAITDEDQNYGYLNGAPVTVEKVRGLSTDRPEDDAVLLDVKEKRHVDLDQSFQVSQGDRIQFGEADGNYFQYLKVSPDSTWIVPQPNVNTGITDRLGIVSKMKIDFPSGSYLVHVESMSEEDQSGTMRVVKANPLVDVDFNLQSTEGLTADFRTNVEATGGVETIEWDIDGDGNYEETGRDILYTFDNGGDKTVTMRASADGFSSTRTKTVTVEAPSCTYEFSGTVIGHKYQDDGVTGEVHIEGGNSQVGKDGSYLTTRTVDCGSTVTVEYVEEGSTVASTQVDVPNDDADVTGIEIDAGDSRTETDYDMQSYSRGDVVTLSPGDGLEFGENSKLFLESISRYDEQTLITEAWADRIVQDYSSVDNINRYKFGIPSNDYSSTVQQFNMGEHAVGTCELTANSATFVVETLDNTNSDWPDAWCENGERPDLGDDPSAYTTREIDLITDYLGGNVPAVENMTEIRFGDDMQNSLFVEETYDDGYDNGKIVASPGSPENEAFTLTWDDLPDGKIKQFTSSEYTVHLCSRGDRYDGKPHMAISREEGNSGYDACFEDEYDAQYDEWNSVDYVEGTTVNVDEGDRLEFNGDKFYVDSLKKPEGMERYDLNGYRSRPMVNHQTSPVEGTVSNGYFLTGHKNIYFCNYNETIQKAKITITGQDLEQEVACSSETAEQPAGTISFGSSTYIAGTEGTAQYSISQQGGYEVRVKHEGQTISTKNQDMGTGEYEISFTPESSGSLTAQLVAPGQYWNPFNNERIIAAADATVEAEEVGPEMNALNQSAFTYEWGDQISVSEGTEISPVYWGEGFQVERIGNGILEYIEYSRENTGEMNEGSSKTIRQDYVLHTCTAGGGTAEIIITGGSEDTEQICEESESVDIEAQINSVPTNVDPESSVTVSGTVTSKVAEEGYRVRITGDGYERTSEVINSEDYEKRFDPDGSWKSGEATAQVIPTQSLIESVNPLNSLEPMTEHGYSVNTPQEEVSSWRGFCQNNGFSEGMNLGQARKCIQNEVVPECFRGSPGANCESIGNSICNDLYGANYDREETVCNR